MPWPSFEDLLWRLHAEIAELRGLIHSHSDRMDKLEQRQDKDQIKWSDLLPFLPGGIVLVLWLTGRVDTAALVGLLSGR